MAVVEATGRRWCRIEVTTDQDTKIRWGADNWHDVLDDFKASFPGARFEPYDKNWRVGTTVPAGRVKSWAFAAFGEGKVTVIYAGGSQSSSSSWGQETRDSEQAYRTADDFFRSGAGMNWQDFFRAHEQRRQQQEGARSRDYRPFPPQNHHATLGVTQEAPFEVIKAAYKALAQLHHPDHGGSEERMKTINAAYEALKKAYGRGG